MGLRVLITLKMVQIKNLLAAGAFATLAAASPMAGGIMDADVNDVQGYIKNAATGHLNSAACKYNVASLDKYQYQVVAGVNHFLTFSVQSNECDHTECEVQVYEFINKIKTDAVC